MLLNKSLAEQLKQRFEVYLQTQGHTPKTTISYVKSLQLYLNWLIQHRLSYLGISYEQLLGYVQQGQQKGHKVKTINQNLMVVRKFYTYLLSQQPDEEVTLLTTIQALGDLRLRGGTRYLLHDVLTEERLATIYATYPSETMAQMRNKCILGMMIYQALHAGDISRIKLVDLDLDKAVVYIAATRRSNERTLPLHAQQIAGLQKYLLGVRSALLNYSEKGSSTYLFVSENGGQSLKVNLNWLYVKIRKEHTDLKHINQIRSSVIRHWLKKDNIRLVQYKLGHRYLSSTQMYLEGDIESLQQQIDRLHPLNDQSLQ